MCYLHHNWNDKNWRKLASLWLVNFYYVWTSLLILNLLNISCYLVKLELLYFHYFSMEIAIKFYNNVIVHKAKRGPRSLNLILHKHCNLLTFINYPHLQFKYRFGQNYVSESHWILIWGTLEVINVLFPNLVLLLLIPTVKHVGSLMILNFLMQLYKDPLAELRIWLRGTFCSVCMTLVSGFVIKDAMTCFHAEGKKYFMSMQKWDYMDKAKVYD